jgi:hypothetical protein
MLKVSAKPRNICDRPRSGRSTSRANFMNEATDSNEGAAAPAPKDPAIAAATDRAQAAVSPRADRAGDNTPTKPGTEAAKAAAGTNETLGDAAKEPETEEATAP